MKAREIIAWSIVIMTYVFMAMGVILGFRLYPFYGTQLPCKAIEISYPLPVPTPTPYEKH